ncbi:hypothetical protein ACFV6F_03290 [Kitasatospora phosalacinea]|uniref:hypothetical protein n=1 Tax=Kitasatospora phosalacinea TaxID=2065 RepID=UPI0036571371
MDQWEDVLSLLAPSQYAERDGRTAVTDPKVEWIGSHAVEVTNGIKGADLGGRAFDAWYSWNFSYTHGGSTSYGSVAVGLTLKWDEFLAATTPFGKFLRDGPRVLYPLWGTGANDRISVASFEDAAVMLEKATWFLDGWIPVTRQWATDVGAPGSDWQGSAAGSFAAVLTAYGRELETLRDRLADADVAGSLRAAGAAVKASLPPLVDAWEHWRNSKEASPVTSLARALAEGLSGAVVHLEAGSKGGGGDFWGNQGGKPATQVDGSPEHASDFTVTFSGAKFGDPQQDDFWVAVKERAKALWEADLKPLDDAARTALHALESSYNHTRTLMENHPVGSPELRMPISDPPATDPGTDDPGKDPTEDPTQDLTGGPDGSGGDGSGTDLGGGTDIEGLGGGSGGTGDGGLDLGTGGGGTGDGTGIGDGLPGLIGGGTGTGGTDLGTGGTGSTTTRPVTLPAGSRITDDGRIVDADGNPVLDANGNPMLAGKDYTIGPDGTLRDASGTPVPQYRQLLTDSYATDSGDDLLAPNRFGTGGYAYSTGTYGSGGTTGTGSGGLPGGLPGITGTGGGLSTRGLANGGDPVAVKAAAEQANAERLAAQKAAAAAAEEQALLTGRQTSTSSSGMPMMPGAGMGGAGAPGEKDRRRTTWLAEDEEVWGTETGAVHGVIGR